MSQLITIRSTLMNTLIGSPTISVSDLFMSSVTTTSLHILHLMIASQNCQPHDQGQQVKKAKNGGCTSGFNIQPHLRGHIEDEDEGVDKDRHSYDDHL